jgi:hypothetical protein
MLLADESLLVLWRLGNGVLPLPGGLRPVCGVERAQTMNRLLIEGSFRETYFTLEGIALRRSGEKLSGTIQTQVMCASEDKHVFRLPRTDRTGLT